MNTSFDSRLLTKRPTETSNHSTLSENSSFHDSFFYAIDSVASDTVGHSRNINNEENLIPFYASPASAIYRNNPETPHSSKPKRKHKER